MEINAVKKMYEDCVIKPNYALVMCHFKDDEDYIFETNVCFGKNNALSDESIFFYTKDFNSFLDLLKKENGEDFEFDEVKELF